MKRKKQGASLIIVVIVFMFLFTVSTAMLSMVASNYKARVTESKRVENLYASDSGLDVAYNIIGKTFDAATKYGYWKVEELKSKTNKGPYNDKYKDIEDDINQLKSDITNLQTESPSPTRSQSAINEDIAKKKSLIEEDENIKDILCDEEFKRAFKNFIKKTKNDDEVEASENVPDNQLEESINASRYVSEITSQNIDTDKPQQTIEFGIKNKNDEPPTLEAGVGDPINSSESSNEIKGIYSTLDGGEHDKTVTFTVYGEQYYDICVTSNFYTEIGKENNEINQRQLQAQYKVLVPNYKDIYFEDSSGDLKEYLATKDRALTIYGDMNVNNAKGLTVGGKVVDGKVVGGEVFVQGSDDHSSSDRVYGKYFGGIKLNNSDEVHFESNVITRGTFNIQNTTTSEKTKTTTLDENLYARNVYVGKIENDNNGLESGLSSLNINKELIVNNDLALNANDVTINIQDFYGIGEENIAAKAQSSSSIIVNGNNNSSIYINNSAYLMGTAHIATNGDYQTAESGAVKGNYIAYSIPLHESDKFAYYNPLQLLDADQETKEQHFTEYWSKDGNNADSGGIHWPVKDDGDLTTNDNIWSAGVIVYEKTNEYVEINGETQKKRIVIPSKYDADLFKDTGAVGQRRLKFAQYVYKFGKTPNMNDYNNTILTDFKSLINIGKIPSKYVLTDQQNKGEYAIFNNSTFIENGDTKYKEIKIMKSTDSKDSIDNTDPKVIKIYVGNDDCTLDAVIATGGNVSIESGITIKGCIIAEGDLDINGDNVTIMYDPDVIERIQAKNSDTFNDVFGESIWADTDSASSSTQQTMEDSSSNYDLKKFLQNKLWKILK